MASPRLGHSRIHTDAKMKGDRNHDIRNPRKLSTKRSG